MSADKTPEQRAEAHARYVSETLRAPQDDQRDTLDQSSRELHDLGCLVAVVVGHLESMSDTVRGTLEAATVLDGVPDRLYEISAAVGREADRAKDTARAHQKASDLRQRRFDGIFSAALMVRQAMRSAEPEQVDPALVALANAVDAAGLG